MKLENLLQFKNRIIYLVISIILLILVRNSLWYFLLFPPYLYYLFTNHNELLKIIIIILGLYLLRIYQFDNIEIENSAQSILKVKKDIKIADYTSFKGVYDRKLVSVYINDWIVIRPGDSLLCNVEITEATNNTTPHLFNYRNYLRSQNIKYIVYGSECEVVKNSLDINIISHKLNAYIDDNFEYSNEYIKTFILADKSGFDDSLVKQINEVGISHLFAVSGLHISLIVLSLITLLKKTKMKIEYIEYIIISFLCFYMIITSFSPSVTRASLMFILLIANKRANIGLSSLDILSLIFIFLIFIRPYYYYDAGFLLSFLVTFIILLSSNILKIESKLKQLLTLSIISFLVTIPIILNLNYQVNLLSVFFNILFLFYITYIILPLGYITFIIPFFDRFYYLFIQLFEGVLSVSSRINIFILKMYFSSIFSVIIYYLLVFMLLHYYESKKSLKRPVILIVILIILVWGTPYYNITQKVTFLDIHGDSTIIIDRFDKCNIIIDTGEYDDYNTLVNYLKTNNIKRVDYLIITHYHSDHYGEATDVLNNFKVSNLVNRNNAFNYDGINKCGNIEFFVYSNDIEYLNENNNSIILSLFISGKHYLFTGDIEEKRESNFVESIDIDVDYLKVPHHGSITSSTREFIEDIAPEEVFIIVSRTNKHKHPSDIVVTRYEEMGIKVNRTDLDGTIIVSYLFGKEYKKVHIP